MKDTQSRKWLITINNPLEKNITHEAIKERISKIKPCIYYCMADEVGGKEKTHHTHIYIACSSAVRFSTIKNKFPLAHIDIAKGTSEQNKNYVFKEGKWEKDKKGESKLVNTQFEHGEIPLERQGARNDLSDLYDMIKSGLNNYEILEENPDYMLHIDKLERVRQTFKVEEYKDTFRQLEVTYIWGETATGKTRHVMEKYNYTNVYRVTDYAHPFDGYQAQNVILFDEFCGQFRIHEMLNYLDGYPLELPCRYANKQACYTKAYLISNIDLRNLYSNVRIEYRHVWNAFMRRIHKVIVFSKHKANEEYELGEFLLCGERLSDDTPTPFDS